MRPPRLDKSSEVDRSNAIRSLDGVLDVLPAIRSYDSVTDGLPGIRPEIGEALYFKAQ